MLTRMRALSCFALLAVSACATTLPPSVVGEPRQRSGRYWYFVDNLRRAPGPAGAHPSLRLWVALPPERPGQAVRVGAFSPAPTELLVDAETGTRVAFWRLEPPLDGRPLVFHYDVEVTNRALRFALDARRVRRVAPGSPEARRFLRDEPWLEQTPELVARARAVAGTETNPLRQAQLVFDWVVANVTYDYPDVKDRGARKSFASLRGDCGEFSHIFIAMMRALGVPARSVVANWYEGSGHAWAELFLPPYGWVPVDTSVAQMIHSGLKGQLREAEVLRFMQTRGHASRDPRSLFGALYPHRLEVFVGDNVALGGRTEGASRTFQFLQPGGSNAWPAGVVLEGVAPGAVHGGFYLWGDGRADEARARAHALEELASGYLAAGLHARAAEGLRRALERKPRSAMLHFQLGQAHLALGRTAEALRELEATLQGEGGSLKKTTDTWAHILIGMIHDGAGRRAEAVQHYRAALAVGADFKGARKVAEGFLARPYQQPATRPSDRP